MVTLTRIYICNNPNDPHKEMNISCVSFTIFICFETIPKAWNQKLNAFLTSIEFVKSDVDFSMYVAQVGDVKIFIIIYVDDLILVWNNKDKLVQVKE